jgi:DNA replication protein DnaC
MIFMQQLKTLLFDMKLAGMSHALDSVCAQAADEALSFSEALLLLAQSEKDHRAIKKSQSLQNKATFRNNACLENWDHTFERGLSRQKIRELASLQFIKQNKNLLLLGQTGVGKTQLAIALGRAACNQGQTVRFLSTNQFFEEYLLAQSTGKTLTS